MGKECELVLKIDMDNGWQPRAHDLDMWIARTVANRYTAVLLCILRCTYGWQDTENNSQRNKAKQRRERAQISGKVFEEFCWLSKVNVSQALKVLLEWNVIGRDQDKNPVEYWFNPDVSKWDLKKCGHKTRERVEFREKLKQLQAALKNEGQTGRFQVSESLGEEGIHMTARPLADKNNVTDDDIEGSEGKLPDMVTGEAKGKRRKSITNDDTGSSKEKLPDTVTGKAGEGRKRGISDDKIGISEEELPDTVIGRAVTRYGNAELPDMVTPLVGNANTGAGSGAPKESKESTYLRYGESGDSPTTGDDAKDEKPGGEETDTDTLPTRSGSEDPGVAAPEVGSERSGEVSSFPPIGEGVKNPQVVLDRRFRQRYFEKVGAPYFAPGQRGGKNGQPPISTRDLKMLTNLIKAYGVEQVDGLMDMYFESDDEFILKQGYSIPFFQVQVNKLNLERNRRWCRVCGSAKQKIRALENGEMVETWTCPDECEAAVR